MSDVNRKEIYIGKGFTFILSLDSDTKFEYHTSTIENVESESVVG